jgi:hypothetical protein
VIAVEVVGGCVLVVDVVVVVVGGFVVVLVVVGWIVVLVDVVVVAVVVVGTWVVVVEEVVVVVGRVVVVVLVVVVVAWVVLVVDVVVLVVVIVSRMVEVVDEVVVDVVLLVEVGVVVLDVVLVVVEEVVEDEVVVVVGGAPVPKTGAMSSSPDIPLAMIVTAPVVVSSLTTSPFIPAANTPPRPSAAMPSGEMMLPEWSVPMEKTVPAAHVPIPIVSSVTVFVSRPDTYSLPLDGSNDSPSGAPRPAATPAQSGVYVLAVRSAMPTVCPDGSATHSWPKASKAMPLSSLRPVKVWAETAPVVRATTSSVCPV